MSVVEGERKGIIRWRGYKPVVSVYNVEFALKTVTAAVWFTRANDTSSRTQKLDKKKKR